MNNEEQEKTVETPQEQEASAVDELAEYKTDGQFDVEKIKKLAEDKKYYRTQISKLRQMPQKIEEYSKDFVLDSKFTEYASNEENNNKIKGIFDKLDQLSMEKGIGIERNHDLRRFVLDELVDNKVIDLTSQAEKDAKYQQVINERNETVQKTLGEGTSVEAWNTQLLDWLKTFCNSDGEYKMHEKLIKENALWALSVNKVRQAMLGNRIPVVASESTYNEAEWERNFVKADRETQDKMLMERAQILTKGKK